MEHIAGEIAELKRKIAQVRDPVAEAQRIWANAPAANQPADDSSNDDGTADDEDAVIYLGMSDM